MDLDESIFDAMSHQRFAEAVGVIEGLPPAERDVNRWLQLAQCFAATAQWGRQLAALREAWRLDAGNLRVLDDLFYANVTVGDMRQARSFHALSRGAGLPEWQVRLQAAYPHALRGKIRDAERAWSEAADLAPTDRDRRIVYWWMTDALIRRNLAQRALEVMPKLELGGEPLLFLKARALRRAGPKGSFIKAVDEAIAQGYSHPHWERYKARRVWLLGGREEAIRILEQYHALYPEDAYTVRELLLYLLAMRQPRRALEYARIAVRIKPYAAAVAGAAGAVFLMNGRPLDALRALRPAPPPRQPDPDTTGSPSSPSASG